MTDYRNNYDHCLLCVHYNARDQYCNKHLRGIERVDNFDACPTAETKRGSTDYISREAFIADNEKRYCENCDRRRGMKNGKMKFVYEIGDAPCRACDIHDMLVAIDDFPAADVRENKRGVWCPQPSEFKDSTIFVCSNCGHMILISNERDELPYCGNCGADMREEHDD